MDIQHCVPIEYFPKGQEANQLQPGWILLTHGHDLYSYAIRVGQFIKFRGEDRKFAYFNHAAVIETYDGGIVEAIAPKVHRDHISKYKESEYALIKIPACEHQIAAVQKYLGSVVDTNYGWITALSLGLSLMTAQSLGFSFDTEIVCSGLAAESATRLGEVFQKPALRMLPGDLGKHFTAPLPSGANPNNVIATLDKTAEIG